MGLWPQRRGRQLLLAKVQNADRQDWYICKFGLDEHFTYISREMFLLRATYAAKVATRAAGAARVAGAALAAKSVRWIILSFQGFRQQNFCQSKSLESVKMGTGIDSLNF